MKPIPTSTVNTPTKNVEPAKVQKKGPPAKRESEKKPNFGPGTSPDYRNLTHVLDKKGRPLVSQGKKNRSVRMPRY